MLLYNLAVPLLLMFATIGCKICGIVLWPVVVLHAALVG